MVESQSAQEFLNCVICLDLARNALECEQCHNLCCENCLQMLKKKICPSCRSDPFKTMPAILARRMINSIGLVCPNDCGEKISIENELKHLKICINRQFICQDIKGEGCNFKGKKQEFLAHIIEKHEQTLIDIFDMQNKQNQQDNYFQSIQLTTGANLNFDRICSVNEKGKTCRLGQNGKYYCGGPLEFKCQCCNGFCGPSNGCNCFSCMKLDIKARCLPQGYYVNKEGHACRKGQNGKFYCGSFVMQGIQKCDGYCGPTNGPQCKSCRIIENQSSSRYKNIWQ